MIDPKARKGLDPSRGGGYHVPMESGQSRPAGSKVFEALRAYTWNIGSFDTLYLVSP